MLKQLIVLQTTTAYVVNLAMILIQWFGEFLLACQIQVMSF